MFAASLSPIRCHYCAWLYTPAFATLKCMEITNIQSETLADIGKKHDLKLILLHGSYATGKQHAGSDLDIAILGYTKLSFQQELDVYGDIAKLFGDTKERELDVKSLHATDPLFLYEVARDSQLLYGDRTDYDEFCSRAFVAYMDSRDLRELERLLNRRQLEKLKTAYA